MHKPSLLMIVLAAALAAGSSQASQTIQQPQASGISIQIAKKGADDRQKDDRGGNRLSDDQRGEQLAREGGVRGRGRGI